MYKLICIDMDGTLLNDEKIISEVNKEALKKVSKMGILIVICTGRLFTSARVYSDLIGIDAPLICSNGAYIREKSSGEIIYKNILPIDSCRKALKAIDKYKLTGVFNTADTVITDKLGYSALAYYKMNETLSEDKKIRVEIIKDWEETLIKYQESMLKCIIYDSDSEKLSRAKQEMKQISEIEVVSSSFDNFEVMASGVSKGNAVKVLSDYYNIKREDIICIGDNENDISMIKFSGLGIAMGNAPDNIKREAKFITDTNNNNGVAIAINAFILKV